MSSRLAFPFEETRMAPNIADLIRKEFGIDFSFITSIPVLVQFLRKDGSWHTIEAIFDTGAGISLLPKNEEKEIGVTRYVAHKLSGISRKEECLVPARISRVKSRLLDSYGSKSPEFELWVAFAERDDVPTILGMKDMINNFRFESDPQQKKLYLVWESVR